MTRVRPELSAVLDEQAAAWRRGERPMVEEILDRHPVFRDDLGAVVELVFNEDALRRRAGESPGRGDYDSRFPLAAAALARQFAVESLLATAGVEPAAGGPRGAPPAIDGYEILGELGRGGMGVVFKARDRRLGRLVAIKMIAVPDAGRQALDRFADEAKAVARLRHENIIQIYGHGEVDGVPYLEFEYADGGTLADRLADAYLDPRDAASILATLARAVEFAHRNGVVHRDLKPRNVFLTADGIAKVGDFGLSKLSGDAPGRTLSGQVLGTPSYMAPEQASGPADAVGPAADVYALGAILYEATTGRPPFLGVSSLDTLRQVVEDEVVPPSRLRPRLPRDLETICLKCLEKDPPRRYEGAAALADDLGRFLDGRPIRARRVGLWGRTWRFARRHPVPVGLAASFLVACAIGTGVSLAERRRAEGERDRARRSLDRAMTSIRLFYDVEIEPMMVEELRPYRKRLTTIAARVVEDLFRELDPADAPRADRVRVEAHLALAKAKALDGENAEAIAIGRGAIALAEEAVARRPDATDARRVLALCLQTITTLGIDEEEKLGHLERSNEIYRRLAAEGGPDAESYSSQLVVNAYNLGVARFALGRRAEAIGSLEAGRAVFDELCRRGVPGDEALGRSALLETFLGVAYRGPDGWARARAAGELAVSRARELASRRPDDFGLAWQLYQAQRELGHTDGAAGDMEGRNAFNKEARATLKAMAGRHGKLVSRMAQIQGDLVVIDFNLLNGLDERRDAALRREIVAEANTICEHLVIVRPLSDDQCRVFAYTSFLAAQSRQKEGKASDPELYRRAIRLWTELDRKGKLLGDERRLLWVSRMELVTRAVPFLR